jgi:ribosome-associated translation inhibitor RaiA
MRIGISGLRGRPGLGVEVVTRLSSLLERRRLTSVSVRAAFSDEDGPRGSMAIRCALTVRLGGARAIRIEHTSGTYGAAFRGALSSLKRQLERHAQRGRRRARYRARPPRLESTGVSVPGDAHGGSSEEAA